MTKKLWLVLSLTYLVFYAAIVAVYYIVKIRRTV